jgi:hypothetical protein
MMSYDFSTIKEEATKFTMMLMEGLDKKLKEIEEEKKLINTTSTLEKIDRGIEYFQQSAQIHNLYGIKDSTFDSFLSFYFKKTKVNEDFMGLVKESLMEITLEKNSDWRSYKFLYSKNDTNNSCAYACILAQHDVENQKINWFYTEIETSFNMTDIFVLKTTQIKDGYKKEEQKVLKIPGEVEPQEVNLIVDFFDIVAYKTLGKYFGIESNIDAYARHNSGIQNLMFLK